LERLRKFGEKKRLKLPRAHLCSCHVDPPALASRRLLQ
jgi:hypothetical protein